MLNLIVDYIRPRNISKVSGIPEDWYRSDYNKSKQAKIALEDLVKK
jgi:adenine-specific DNA-methyltransferase